MPQNPNRLPQTPEGSQSPDNLTSNEVARRKRELELTVLRDDRAMQVGINLVNGVARGETEEDAAWRYLHGLNDLLDKIESEDASKPDENSDEDLRNAWDQMDQLRKLCGEAARGDLSREDELAVKQYTEAYRGLQRKLEDALESKSELSAETGEVIDNTEEAAVRRILEAIKHESDSRKNDVLNLGLINVISELDTYPSKEELDLRMVRVRELYDQLVSDGAKQVAQGEIAKLSGMIERRAQLEFERRTYELALQRLDTQPTGNSEENEENESLTPSYEESMQVYADMKAKEEMRGKGGGRLFRWIRERGEKKRSQRFEEAENTLKEKVLAYVTEKTQAKLRGGEYVGTDEEIAQQMSDESFDELRRILDTEVRQATDKAIEERGNKWYNRVAAKIGSWINLGDSRKNSMKAGAVGFGYGFLKGAPLAAMTAIFGVSLPISVAAGAGAALIGNYGIRRGVRLDEIRSRMDGDTRQMVSDEDFESAKNSVVNNGGDRDKKEHMADHLLRYSRRDTQIKRDEVASSVEERMKKRKMALAVGKLAGGVAGGFAGYWTGSAIHEMTSGGGVRAMGDTISSKHSVGPEASSQQPWEGLGGGAEPIEPLEPAAGTPDFSEYGGKFPWDWAADKVGPESAMSKLRDLAEKAVQDGHSVVWHDAPNGVVYLEVDGMTDTQGVLEVITQYDT